MVKITPVERNPETVRVFLTSALYETQDSLLADLTPTRVMEVSEEAALSLTADEITPVRWSDTLAKEILALADRLPEDPERLAEMIVALAVIDKRPLGRLGIDHIHYVCAHIDRDGYLCVTAAETAREFQLARRQLMEPRPHLLAA